MLSHTRFARIWLAVVLLIAGLVSLRLHAQRTQSASRTIGARSTVAPRQEFVKQVIDEAYAKFRSDTAGKNADYIPYLAQVDSKLFGISVVTTDKQSYSVGDTTYAFSIQSI